MNCTEARERMVAAPDGPPMPEFDEHLAGCADCRRELEHWRKLRAMLDAPAAPSVCVSVGQIYASAGMRQQRQTRRWRYAALGCAALAAACLFIAFVRLHVRVEPGGIVLCWGEPTPEPVQAPVSSPKIVQLRSPKPTVTAEDMELAKDLIRALAARLDTLDERQRETATALAVRLEALTYRLRNMQSVQIQKTAYHPITNSSSDQGE